MSCVSSAVADTAPHRPRHHCPLRPMPDILHPAAATLCCFCAHFSTVLLLLCPVSLYFFASLPRLFPFPMCHHGCTGLRGTRIPEALNHAACRGRRDSPFFRVVRGGRNGRTVRANHISRRETSGTYEDEDRFRLIGAGFPANTFTTERALYQYFSIILQKILNELLICTE